MLLALLSVMPVGLGLFLLAFGVPGRPFLQPTGPNLALVAVAAVLAGPVAQLALGFGAWLALIGLLVCLLLLAAGVGPPRRRALQE